MARERSGIPWPNYIQWVFTMATFGCIGFVVAFIGPIALGLYDLIHARIAHEVIKVHRSSGFLPSAAWAMAGIFVPMALAHTILFTINVVIRTCWWMRIGRLTTWHRVQAIPTDEHSAYEILLKPIFVGGTSFGTYQTVGGWQALLLHHKSTGQLWVLRGRFPAECDKYGIDIVRV